MLTPSGRFETNKKICLSISSFHPKNWQPSWIIRTVLTALIAFFPTPGHGAIGSLDYSSHERKEYAARSGAFRCELCERTNLELLPERAAGAGGAAAVPQLPKEVTDTIDSNKAIPALTGVASQPATPAHGGAGRASHGPPTPLNLIQAQRIADAPSNVTSPSLVRSHSEPVQHPPGQHDPVGEGSMLPPPGDALAAAAAASSPAASPTGAAAANPATPRASPLVLDEGLRQRQGRVVMPAEQQAHGAVPAVEVAAAPAPGVRVVAPAAPAAVGVAVAAPRAAPLSSVTVFITFAILLILMRKLYASVNRQPAFGGFEFEHE